MWNRPHTAQAPTTAAYDLTPTPVAWPRSYEPASLPDLGATDERLVESWAQPRTSLATTTAGYDLLPIPGAWPRSDYAAVAATAAATLFGPADLEALTYRPPTPSFRVEARNNGRSPRPPHGAGPHHGAGQRTSLGRTELGPS